MRDFIVRLYSRFGNGTLVIFQKQTPFWEERSPFKLRTVINEPLFFFAVILKTLPPACLLLQTRNAVETCSRQVFKEAKLRTELKKR